MCAAECSVRQVLPDDRETIVNAVLAWAGEANTWGPIPGPSRQAPDGVGVLTRFVGTEVWLEPDWDALTATPPWAFLIAEQDGEFVGFARGACGDVTGKLLLALPDGGELFEITEVYVMPAQRGRGVGGRLVDALLEAASARGLRRATLVSAAVDTDAILRFYRRRGFRPWWVEFVRDI